MRKLCMLVLIMFCETTFASILEMPTICWNTPMRIYSATGDCNFTRDCKWHRQENAENCSDLNKGEWTIKLKERTFYGTSICNDKSEHVWRGGADDFDWSGNDKITENERNKYCWCKVTKYITEYGDSKILSTPLLSFDGEYNDVSVCASQCASSCLYSFESVSFDEEFDNMLK